MKLTIKQARFHKQLFDTNGKLRSDNNYKEFAYFGGFGSGKSLITMLSTYQICMTYPKTHWLYARSTYGELADSVIPQFNELFQEKGYVYKKIDREAKFNNGSVIKFRAYDKDTKILSNQYHGATFCQAEELAEEMYLQTWGRLRMRGNGIPKNIIMMEGNPAAGWCKTKFKDNPLGDHTYFIEATTMDNDYLPEDYIDTMKRNYPDNWVARYIYGEWNNLDEMVFNEFRDCDHIIEPVDPQYIPGYCHLRMGLDYGWRTPSCILWAYINQDQELIFFDEFYEKEQTAKDINDASMRHFNTIKKKIICVADFSIKKPDRDGKSLWDDLEKFGMILTESNKDELRNITNFNLLLKQKRIKITRNCVNFIREIKNYKWKKVKLGSDKEIPDEPIQKDNHAIDAALYITANLEHLNVVTPEQIEHKRSLEYINVRPRQGAWLNNG